MALAKFLWEACSICVAELTEQLDLSRHTLLDLRIHADFVFVVHLDCHLESGLFVESNPH